MMIVPRMININASVGRSDPILDDDRVGGGSIVKMVTKEGCGSDTMGMDGRGWTRAVGREENQRQGQGSPPSSEEDTAQTGWGCIVGTGIKRSQKTYNDRRGGRGPRTRTATEEEEQTLEPILKQKEQEDKETEVETSRRRRMTRDYYQQQKKISGREAGGGGEGEGEEEAHNTKMLDMNQQQIDPGPTSSRRPAQEEDNQKNSLAANDDDQEEEESESEDEIDHQRAFKIMTATGLIRRSALQTQHRARSTSVSHQTHTPSSSVSTTSSAARVVGRITRSSLSFGQQPQEPTTPHWCSPTSPWSPNSTVGHQEYRDPPNARPSPGTFKFPARLQVVGTTPDQCQSTPPSTPSRVSYQSKIPLSPAQSVIPPRIVREDTDQRKAHCDHGALAGISMEERFARHMNIQGDSNEIGRKLEDEQVGVIETDSHHLRPPAPPTSRRLQHPGRKASKSVSIPTNHHKRNQSIGNISSGITSALNSPTSSSFGFRAWIGNVSKTVVSGSGSNNNTVDKRRKSLSNIFSHSSSSGVAERNQKGSSELGFTVGGMVDQPKISQTYKPENKTWSSLIDEESLKSYSDKERKRQEAIFELIQTESIYIESLERILLNYYDDLYNLLFEQIKEEEAEQARGGGGSNEKEQEDEEEITKRNRKVEKILSKVFLNLDEIIVFGTKLLSCLEIKQKQSNYKIESIGDILYERFIQPSRPPAPTRRPEDRTKREKPEEGERLESYIYFCLNQFNSLNVLNRMKLKYPKIEKFLKSKKILGFEIEHYLILPMQRLTRYPLLFDQILKYTDESSKDFKLVKIVLKRCQDLLRATNEAIRERENEIELINLSERLIIPGSDAKLNLASMTRLLGRRKLIKQGILQKHKSKKTYKMYLFNDLILITILTAEAVKMMNRSEPMMNLNNKMMNKKLQDLKINNNNMKNEGIGVGTTSNTKFEEFMYRIPLSLEECQMTKKDEIGLNLIFNDECLSFKVLDGLNGSSKGRDCWIDEFKICKKNVLIELNKRKDKRGSCDSVFSFNYQTRLKQEEQQEIKKIQNNKKLKDEDEVDSNKKNQQLMIVCNENSIRKPNMSSNLYHSNKSIHFNF